MEGKKNIFLKLNFLDAVIFFYTHATLSLTYDHVFFPFCRAVSKLLGENWRELSEEKRDEFARNAKEMADERMKVNPDCWKRKHRKDKDSTGKTIGDAMSQDPKKMK